MLDAKHICHLIEREDRERCKLGRKTALAAGIDNEI